MASVSVIPHDSFGISSKARVRSAKDAWKGYCKQRWPRATLDEVRAEWGLSEWEARSIVYGQISQTTEEKIFGHRKWTLLDAFDFFLYRCSTTCNELADHLDMEAERERLVQNGRAKPRQRVALRLAPERGGDTEAPQEVVAFDGRGERP